MGTAQGAAVATGLLALMLLSGCASAPRQKPDPSEPAEINFKLGVGYMQSGHFEVAREKLTKALEFDPQMAEAHNALGVLHQETGDGELAERHYRWALGLDSDFALAKTNLGLFLCENGRFDEGERMFASAVRGTDEERQRALLGAAACARSAGRAGRAEGFLRQALEIDRVSPRVLLELAGLMYAEDEPLKARAFLQRYHALAGFSAVSLDLGIAIERALGDGRSRERYESLLLAKFADSHEAQRILRAK